MRTDIPLKRLTALRSSDLLALFGLPDAQVLKVETLSLPESATELDNVLHLRSPQGQDYLHVIEWQGYHDPAVLWRMTGYLSWLGRRAPAQTILGTLVYLAPAYDVGDTLTQTVDGQVMQAWKIPCVRLWEQEAAAALASGNLALIVLSPLMHNADSTLVMQAADLLRTQAPPPQQADLLSMLGVFAEPLIDIQRFIDMIGKEPLMSSDLLSYLMQEKTAELEAQFAAKLAAKLAAKDKEYLRELQQSLEAVLAARFPQAPFGLVEDIQRVTSLDKLRGLLVYAAKAAAIEEFEPHLKQAARDSQQAEIKE
jgi:hypothetical protein